MGCLANARDEIACGMLLRVSHNRNANSEARGLFALGYSVERVVGALRVDIWSKLAQKSAHVKLIENYNVIYGCERGNEFRASLRGQYRTAGPFQSAHTRVRIYRNDKDIAFAARSFEIAHVSRVQNIETAVREDDLPAVSFVLSEARLQISARKHFGTRVHADAVASPRIAFSSSARVTVAVPRFITTIPPA